MDVSLCERFAKVRNYLGLTQKEFSLKISATQGNIAMIETFKREPSKQHIVNIISNWDTISPRWLLTGIGDMIEPQKSYKNHTPKEAVFDPNTGKVTTLYNRLLKCPTSFIPLGGEIAAGQPAECYPDPDAEPLSMPIILLKDSPAMYCILRVSGNSMEPVVLNNDLVLIHYCRDWRAAEGKISAIRLDGEITLKEVQLDAKRKMIYLHPYNHSHKMLIVDPDEHQDIHLIGVMEMLIRSIEQ